MHGSVIKNAKQMLIWLARKKCKIQTCDWLESLTNHMSYSVTPKDMGERVLIPNTNKETSSYILFSDTKYVILKLYNYDNTMLCVHFYAVWLL